MKYSIEIECTVKCPWLKWNILNKQHCIASNEHLVKIVEQAPAKCPGLGNPGCPFQEESCETCELKDKVLTSIPAIACPVLDKSKVTHCSAYRRAK